MQKKKKCFQNILKEKGANTACNVAQEYGLTSKNFKVNLNLTFVIDSLLDGDDNQKKSETYLTYQKIKVIITKFYFTYSFIV